jgi:hypothetical protein
MATAVSPLITDGSTTLKTLEGFAVHRSLFTVGWLLVCRSLLMARGGADGTYETHGTYGVFSPCPRSTRNRQLRTVNCEL